MLVGTVAALVTAVTLGANNVLATVASRRFGTLVATVASLSVALGLLLLVVFGAGLHVHADSSRTLQLAALAVFAAAGYIGVYEGLRLGPLTVVSPISATSGAVTTVLAIVLLGERPTPLQWLSIPMIVLGAIAAALVFDSSGGRRRTVAVGAVAATIGVLAGSVSNVGLAAPVHEIGAIEAITIQRVFTVLLLGSWLGVSRLRARRVGQTESPEIPIKVVDARDLLVLLGIGALDALGFGAFALGLSAAPAWLVGLVSQSGRIAASWAGMTMFGERLHRAQWFGIGFIVLGIIGVAVGEGTGW